MKFLKIKFTNYRCFIRGEIDFSIPCNASKKKNIILFSAENGGGKTQLMFAFRFALYGLGLDEFKSIPGQDASPYALNQNVYAQLSAGSQGDSANATVELSFIYDQHIFTVSRTHTFRKGPTTIAGPIEQVVLYIQDRNGDTKVVKDADKVRYLISQVIPEQTLYALLCDGERVRQLSSTGQEANNAIQAVIQRMTEHETLTLSQYGIEKVKKSVRKLIGKNVNNPNDRVDVSAIENCEKNIARLKESIMLGNDTIAQSKRRIDAISTDLREIADVKEKEQKRAMLLQNIDRYEIELKEWEGKLIETLNDQSYWGIADSLSDCVTELLKDILVNFPGLQSEVVATVLKGDTCICGRPIDEVARKVLNELRLRLPPLNIDAELSSVLHQYGNANFRENRRKVILERLSKMQEISKSIADTNDDVASISSEISASANPNAVHLEEENKQCVEQIMDMTRKIALWEEDLAKANETLGELNQKLENAATKDAAGKDLEIQLNLLKQAERGIELIKTYREKLALTSINRYLANAFSNLRSHSDSARQAYITQFESVHRLVVYHAPSVEKEFRSAEASALTEEEQQKLFEELVLKHANGNSMGQLKMSSLAFMKAVLDYVKEVAASNKNMSDAAYPIVLDAPFGDIKRENYINAANYLHEFADQVILLLADEDVPQEIQPYVGKLYGVRRTKSESLPYEYSEIYLVS